MISQENKIIGESFAKKRRIYREVKNPLKGSLLERRMQRAIYCVENDVDSSFINWFVAEAGMTPQAFLDKQEKAYKETISRALRRKKK